MCMDKRLFPNTLYLPDRALLAVKSLIRIIDRESGLPYCLFDILSDPPVMSHTCFDWSDHTARTIDALILGQELAGTNCGEEAIRFLTDKLKAGFGEDGLHYTPDNKWTSEQANMHYQRSVLNALISLTSAYDSQEARKHMLRLIDGLYDISVKRDGFWYFPAVEYFREGWFRGDWDILGYAVDPANTNGRLLFGLCRAYELTGSEKARELAENYVNHVMYHSSAFLEDGSFASGMEFREGHFHSRAVTVLGVIRFAYTFRNERAFAWGRKVYDRALAYGTRAGWFPERIVPERAHGCETCAVVDMMEAAVWLAKCGLEEYWETAERILRNQLAESQLCSLEVLKEARWRINGQEHTTNEELEAFVGGFSGWSEPNDLLSKVMHGWDLYLCCCAQGVRGMFNAWSNVVSRKKDAAEIHFLINYGDEELTIRSWLPDFGRLEILSRTDSLIRLRIPEWVEIGSLRILEDGSGRPVRMSGCYLELNAKKDKVIEITFEVPEFTLEETVLGVTYTSTWRGSSVVSISPEGTMIPLYETCGKIHETNMAEKTVSVLRFHL